MSQQKPSRYRSGHCGTGRHGRCAGVYAGTECTCGCHDQAPALRVGSLFSGYGGLDQAVTEVLGGDVAWHCEFDPRPASVLAHRYPDVPNLGDITAVDWATVEPVDILTGGFPCQDVSAAGRRAGLKPGTRSGLWNHMAYAISQLRPRLVVIENVGGLLSAEAHSDMEPCPWCVGDGPDEHALRALGAVLGDLAALGFDAEWCGVRASDIGAAHPRFRIIVIAYPADSAGAGLEGQRERRSARSVDGIAAHAANLGHERHRIAWVGRGGSALNSRGSVADAERGSRTRDWHTLAGDSATADGSGEALPGRCGGAATDAKSDGPLRQNDGSGVAPSCGSGERNAHGNDRVRAIADSAGDGWEQGRPEPEGLVRGPDAALSGDAPADTDSITVPWRAGDRATVSGQSQPAIDWGKFGLAIRRWESVLGRPAPAPWQLSERTGNRQLSARFTEWLMGLPDGWVTDVPGMTRNAALHVLGNGVVPQQAAYALRLLLARTAVAAA